MAKLAIAVPLWLEKLPPGEYTIVEVCKLTKATTSNVYIRFQALGVEKKLTRKGHIWNNIYFWKGAKHYVRQEFEKKMKELPNGF